MHSKNPTTNLFIIFTPLHAIIATSIIDREKLDNILVVVLSDATNKTLQYCQRLFPKHAHIENIELHRNIKSIISFFKIYKIKQKLKNSAVTIFTGSIKSLYSRLFIGSGIESQINTFDDGYGNLVLDGYFSKEDAKLKSILLFFLGIRTNYILTLGTIEKHYTLYNLPNVYDQHCKQKITITIDPSDDAEIEFCFSADSNPVKILLTQPYSERKLLSADEEKELYDAAIRVFSINFYLPHPAEEANKITHEKAILLKSNFIAEDVILSIAKRFSVEVYAYGSTALLNLMGVENIKCVWMTTEKVGHPAPDLEPIIIADMSNHKK